MYFRDFPFYRLGPLSHVVFSNIRNINIRHNDGPKETYNEEECINLIQPKYTLKKGILEMSSL